MSEDKTIEHLLEQVSTISKKYKDIAKITGENFNIFHILNMASDEVGLHSRLIGELLNPKGSHDQGAMFLQIFLEECGLLEFVEGTDLDLTKVAIEESIGRIGENHEEGGRIDLVLKFNNGKFIVIENKIYAVDQPKQLLRYKKAYSTAKIVYLNLGGKDEVTKEISGLKVEEFIWISYKTEILNWLEKSAKEAYGLPNIQYIFDHYIKTVKYLTNQNTNNNMSDEMNEVILNSKSNIDSAFKIKNQVEVIKQGVFKQLEIQFKEAIYQRLSVKYNIEYFADKNFGNKDTSIGYFIKVANEPFRLVIHCLENYNKLLIGLSPLEEFKRNDLDFRRSINTKITKIQSNKCWETWRYVWIQIEEFEYRNINNADVIWSIYKGESIEKLYNLIDLVLLDIQDLLEPKEV